SKVLFVVIYAPQQGSCKRALWDYMSILLGQWNGDVIMMGDFNEFIASSGLVDVKMEGYTFTWSHPSATKISKLDRMIRFKKKLKDLKVIIRLWIKDKRLHLKGAKTDISKELQEIDKEMDSGVVSDTRSQLAIRGVFVDGRLCTAPDTVTNVFLNHFESRFKKPITSRLKLNSPFNKRLSRDQADNLERLVSRDEIKLAVWNCGENKSPGPDGYTFEFFRR
nr:RNA-directed DNA polymerase, eukaryota [Tanacetum cinerariifolium]